VGNIPVGGGFAINPPGTTDPVGRAGFNLQAHQAQAMTGQQSQAQQMAQHHNQSVQQQGVTCSFGKETLLAAWVNSCENAGGQVNPAQVSYTVQCNLGGNVVMTPSKAACDRVNGQVAQ